MPQLAHSRVTISEQDMVGHNAAEVFAAAKNGFRADLMHDVHVVQGEASDHYDAIIEQLSYN